MTENHFYTLRGYDRIEEKQISAGMEDYLEMICRLRNQKKDARIKTLAELLNVTPPSASKMAGKLKEKGFIDFEPYGVIRLTEKGKEMGAYLLYRHEVLHQFFCKLNHSKDELELVEKIEHFIDKKTVKNLEAFIRNGSLND